MPDRRAVVSSHFITPDERSNPEPVPVDQLTAAVRGEGDQKQPGKGERERHEAKDAEADPAVVPGEPAHREKHAIEKIHNIKFRFHTKISS